MAGPVPAICVFGASLLILLAFFQFVGDLFFEIGHQRLAELLARRHAGTGDDRLPRNQLLPGRRPVERREIVQLVDTEILRIEP